MRKPAGLKLNKTINTTNVYLQTRGGFFEIAQGSNYAIFDRREHRCVLAGIPPTIAKMYFRDFVNYIYDYEED